MENKIVKTLSFLFAVVSYVCMLSIANAQWMRMNGTSDAPVASLVVDKGTIVVSSSGDIFRSTDNGVHWNEEESAMGSDTAYNAIYVLAESEDNIIAGTLYGTFHSTDNGVHWEAANNGLREHSTTAIAVEHKSVFIGNDGVYLSTDNCTSWMPRNGGVGDYITALGVSGGNLFAGVDEEGIYRSTDSGAHWTTVNNGFPPIAVFHKKGHEHHGIAKYPHVYGFAISGNTVFAATDRGVFRSMDAGMNWIAQNSGLSGKALIINTLYMSGKNIFIGTDAGIFLSTNNGAVWNSMNNGLHGGALEVDALVENEGILYAGTAIGLYKRQLSK
jgi:photosystem II stability/assembly factor-like uncharacterized protein